ncbi:lamin tail domain-containing protein [Halomicrobium katesii]|uniref:lamin tail domain-containing protein n=1 Tax=Halomicrobium katesii TaxID=437163 RepID=UPI0003703A21|nr:lamin tail domain-containing protein [Halomicrobium katesii]
MDRRRSLLVALVALAALAGCLSGGPQTPAAPGDAVPAGSDTVNATVTRVVDGDTVEIRYDDGTFDTVRLLGIDTPETRGGTNSAEFEGVPDTAAGRACLERAAGNATRALEALVGGVPVVVAVDPKADRRDRYDRLLAYLVVDGVDANERLVERGHARVYDSTFSRSDRFYDLEANAQDARRGVWACVDPATPTGGVGLRVVADAPGDDRENPNGESVVVSNSGGDPLAIGNWTVTDEAGHRYTFPPGATVPANGSVRLHSGSGTDTATEFYRGNGPIWNNDGDTATLRAANGTVVAAASY